jgi:hypothetical protein
LKRLLLGATSQLIRWLMIISMMSFLLECGWTKYYPELHALIGCPLYPEWHPEVDVWNHTLHSLDAFVSNRIGNDWEVLVVVHTKLHCLGNCYPLIFDDQFYVILFLASSWTVVVDDADKPVEYGRTAFSSSKVKF